MIPKAAMDSELREAYMSMVQQWQGDSGDSDFEAESMAGSFISDSFFPPEGGYNEIHETYIRSARSILLCEEDFQTDEMSDVSSVPERPGSNWEPGITVPKPFKMTIRDENAPIKAEYSRKFVANLVKHRRQEQKSIENPLTRCFKARPPPPSTFLPIYDELQQKALDKKQFIRDYNQDLLQEKTRPFNLSSGVGNHSRKCSSMGDLSKVGLGGDFRANPVPKHLLSEELDDKIEEQERKRRDLRKLRARELLSTSYLPQSMQERAKADVQKVLQQKRHRSTCFNQFSYSPQIRRKVPNFKKQQNQCHREEVKTRHVAIRRSQSWTNLPTQPIKTNTAATLRIEAMKAQIRRFEQYRKETLKAMEKKDNIETEIAEKIREKLRAIETESYQQEMERKQKLREAEAARKIEYAQQLAEIEEKLGLRPSVLERQELLLRKQSAETRYRKALLSAGVKSHRTFAAKEVASPAAEEEEQAVGEVPTKPDEEKMMSSPSESSSVTSSTVSSQSSPKSKVSKSSATSSSKSRGKLKIDLGKTQSSERKTTLSDEISSSSHGTKTFGSPACSNNNRSNGVESSKSQESSSKSKNSVKKANNDATDFFE